MDDRKQWQKQIDLLLYPSQASPWLCSTITVYSFILIFLGFGIAFIFRGVTVGLLRLSLYSETAYRLSARIRGTPLKFPDFERAPLPWYRLPIIALQIGIDLLYIGMGVWCIARMGLCGQNFICLLIKYVL